MKGAYQIRVKNNRNSYMFELRRNITILRGESGRGKTTLFDMIYEFNRFGKNSGVAVSCDRELIALSGDDWENVKHRTQTISRMYQEGLIKDSDIYGNIEEIISGTKKGREKNDEFIYFCSVGLAFIDIALAQYVYEKSINMGYGCLYAFN